MILHGFFSGDFFSIVSILCNFKLTFPLSRALCLFPREVDLGQAFLVGEGVVQ